MTNSDNSEYSTNFSRGGFTLVEILIGLGLASGLALVVAQIVINQGRGVANVKTTATRNELTNRIARFAGDARSLDRTATAGMGATPEQPVNKSFADCVNGTTLSCGGAACCNSTVPDQPLALTNPSGNLVAGPPASPVLYNANGAVCSGPPSTACGIEVFTTFTPDCAGASPCLKARRVSVKYTIRQAPTVPLLDNGVLLSLISNNVLSAVPLVLTIQGQPNTIAKWITSSEVGDSVMIEQAGNIGVGMAPSAWTKLDVTGYARANALYVPNSNSDPGYGLCLGTSLSAGGFCYTSEQWLMARATGTSAAAGAKWDFGSLYNDASGSADRFLPITFSMQNIEQMRITPAGNVGIGTATPSTRLHLHQAADTKNGGVVVSNTANNAWLAIWVDAAQRSHIGGYTSSPDAIVIDNGSGNVGIGTTAPSYPLDVTGATRLRAPAGQHHWLYLDTTSTGVADQIIFSEAGVMKASIQHNPTMYPGGLMFQTGGASTATTRMVIDAAGTTFIASGPLPYSDSRLKRDITPISNALNRVTQLTGVNFYWNEKERGKSLQLGLIAQDVEAQFPEAVKEDATGTKAVNYGALVGPVIEALKELNAKIGGNTEEIQALRAQNETLTRESADMKSYLCAKDPKAPFCR